MNQAKKYFDELAEKYEEEFSDSSVWSISHRIGYRLLMECMSERPQRVVDAGCGTGKWGRLFSRKGSYTVFTDISGEMVARALALAEQEGAEPNSILGLSLSVDNLATLSDGDFDLTLCMGDPLSYCDNHARGIDELVRITRPGGLIFISVDSRFGYLRIFRDREGYDLAALEEYLKQGNIIGWEGLPLHTFEKGELKESFRMRGADCLGIWELPVVSSYFLFDPVFQNRLEDKNFRNALDDIEMEALKKGNGAVGTHHLYGLFRKTTQ